jgi:LysM repeat protein
MVLAGLSLACAGAAMLWPDPRPADARFPQAGRHAGAAPGPRPADLPRPSLRGALEDEAPSPGGTVSRSAEAAPVRGTGFAVTGLAEGRALVIEGRAAPGETVAVVDREAAVGRAVADGAGRWRIAPRLTGPASELALKVFGRDGRARETGQSLVVAMAGEGAATALVALIDAEHPTRVLAARGDAREGFSAPRPGDEAPPVIAHPPYERYAQSGVSAGAGAGALRIRMVEVDDRGRVFASGSAAPGAPVRVFVDDDYLATARAGADGLWSVRAEKPLKRGIHLIRAEEIDRLTARSLARAETTFDFRGAPGGGEGGTAAGRGWGPFAPPQLGAYPPHAIINGEDSYRRGRYEIIIPGKEVAQAPVATPPAATPVAAPRSYVVERGDSLWRISRRFLGQGWRYTVIYDANRDQIRDPGLIFPGQRLAIPPDPVGAVEGGNAVPGPPGGAPRTPVRRVGPVIKP